MSLLLIITSSWLCAATLVFALCRVAAEADADLLPLEADPRTGVSRVRTKETRAQWPPAEGLPEAVARAHSRSAQATVQRRAQRRGALARLRLRRRREYSRSTCTW